MKRVLHYSLVLVAMACLVGLVTSDAQAKPGFGGGCTGCHGAPGGDLDVLDSTGLTIGEDGQIVFDVTNLPAAKGAIKLTGLDASGLGATVGAGWTSYGDYYASDYISGTGPVTLDLMIDPGATLGDYDIGVQFVGHNMWGSASDFTIGLASAPVPEPTTLVMLLGVSVLGLVLHRRRRNK